MALAGEEGYKEKQDVVSFLTLTPSLQSCGRMTADQHPVMTKTLFQNALLLLLYFVLHIMVWGEQMCSGGLTRCLESAKQSATHW